MVRLDTLKTLYNEGRVVARVDTSPEDYENSGWIALVKDGYAYLYEFSHCSCYGTWDPDASSFDWEGPVEDLYNMALRRLDPHMPDRVITDEDCDGKLLPELYRKILEQRSREDLK